ncbi:hypothetical protein Tco_1477789 [Tanacetum coccineum]
MSTPDHIYPIIVPSDFDVKDAFSFTTTPEYTPASPNYFPASLGNTSPNPSDDLSKYVLASLAISPFHDDPYMKVMQAYNATSNESPFSTTTSSYCSPNCFASISSVTTITNIGKNYHGAPDTSYTHHEQHIETILNHLDELPLKRIEHVEDKIEGLESRTHIAELQKEKMGHNDEIVLDRVRISTLEMLIEDIQKLRLPDESIFAELDNSLWIILNPLRSEPVPEKPNKMSPKRTPTSEAPVMTQVAIRKLVADSVATALEAQAATMANADNTNRNTRPREALVARKCRY